MSLRAHKGSAVAQHTTTTPNLAFTHHELSIATAIDAAKADTDKPSVEQSLAEQNPFQSDLAKQGSLDVGQGLANLHYVPPGDPDSGAPTANSSVDITNLSTAANALRASLLFEPAIDPTQKANGDFGPGGGSQSSLEHLQAALGHQESSQQGSDEKGPFDNPAHDKVMSMVSDEGSASGWDDGWTTSGQYRFYRDDGGHMHYEVMTFKADDSVTDVDKDLHNGDVVSTEVDANGSTAVLTTPGPDHITDVGDNTWFEKAVFAVADAIDAVGDLIKGDDNKDGSGDSNGGNGGNDDDMPDGDLDGNNAQGGGASMPDEDHRYNLPPAFDDILKSDIAKMQPPSHEGDLVNVEGSGGTGTSDLATGGSTTVVGSSQQLGDPGNPNVPDSDNGGGTGGPMTDPNSNQNIINPGPDSDDPVQMSGPEERDTHHEVKHDAPGASHTSGSSGNGGETHHGLTLADLSHFELHGIQDHLPSYFDWHHG